MPKPPTVGQWSALDFAIRHDGWVSPGSGRGAYRPLPGLRRRGWVDEHDRVTEAGKAVVAAWRYDEQTGKLTPA